MPDERIVWGEGPLNAKVVILGQNPGPDEMEAGRPFIGGSGRVLDRALQKVGLARSCCYITNVVKHYVPPGHPVPQELIKQDFPLLQKELSNLANSTTILTLGKEAFDSITGKDLKTRHNRKAAEKNPRYWLRGCPLRLDNRWWVLPGVHPSFVMRTGFAEGPLFEIDLERARRFNEGALPPDEHFNYNATDQEIIEYVKDCINAGECGLDIETPETTIDDDELDPMYVTPIELIGISCRVGEAIGIRPTQFDLLRPLLEGVPNSRRVVCWTHNGSNFDFYHLGKQFSLEGVIPADCMLGMHLLWPHLTNKDAATCFSIFCDIPYYKNTRKLNPDFYNTVGNCRDAYGVFWAGQVMLREMRKFPGMEPLFWNHMMGVRNLINEIRVLGINTNVFETQKTLVMLGRTLDAYEKWWNTNIPTVSWSSPKQLLGLFKAMGMPIFKRKRVKKDEEGNKSIKQTETCDDEALEEYVKRGNKTAALIQTMRALKHAGDLVSVAAPDGRIHTRLKLHGQVGGRIQAVDGNVQTIPEELSGVYPRSIVIPDKPDQVIVVADFSQIELRLYAIQSKAQRMLDRLNSGDYIYGFFHEEIFQKPFFVEGLPRTKENTRPDIQPWEILVDKSWPLGFLYGRGIPDNTGLPIARSKCKEIYERFHRDNPEFGKFHSELEYQATRKGYLITPFGRIRRFPNPKALRNEILAFPGQTTAVDVLYRNALLPLPKPLKIEFGGRVLFPVHDSVVCQVNRSCLVDAVKFIQTTMQSPLPELGGFNIPATLKVGYNWGELMSLEKFLVQTAA
jgi:uracil-DNA glycosylase family 4